MFALFSFESVNLLLVNYFTYVCVWSEPNVFASHKLFEAGRQVNLGVILEVDFVVLGILLAAEVVLLGFFISRPLREVRQRFILEVSVHLGLTFLLDDYAFAWLFRIRRQNVF